MQEALIAPDGGRIHTLSVSVNPMRPWNEAIDGIGSHAMNETEIRNVSDSYPPQSGSILECNVVLVNFGKAIPTGKEALAWASQYNLCSTKPQVVFAIGEHKQCLPTELELPDMAIASTEPSLVDGQNRVCSIWYLGSERNVFDIEFDGVWNSNVWFAFEKEDGV